MSNKAEEQRVSTFHFRDNTRFTVEGHADVKAVFNSKLIAFVRIESEAAHTFNENILPTSELVTVTRDVFLGETPFNVTHTVDLITF